MSLIAHCCHYSDAPSQVGMTYCAFFVLSPLIYLKNLIDAKLLNKITSKNGLETIRIHLQSAKAVCL